jgi:hypothetical protein
VNRRADAHPISVIILTAAIVVIVIVASAYITAALSTSSGNLEFQTMVKTTTALGDILNSMAFKQYATDGIQMNLRYGDQEIFNSLGYTVTIAFNSTKTLTLNLLPTANFSYVQGTGYIVLPLGKTYLTGNGSLFASASTPIVNIFEWKNGKIAYISTLPRIQYATQEVTFFNNTKATYLYLNYVQFNTTSTLPHISFGNIFTFKTVASSLTVQTWKIVTGSLTVTSNNCASGCSFQVTPPTVRTVVIVLSTSTITLSKG